MIQQIDTYQLNWMLSGKENFITFLFKAIAKQIEKHSYYISLDNLNHDNQFMNCSVLEILYLPVFKVHRRKN